MGYEELYFLLIGIAAGALGGLFGVGGGFIFIPAQLFLYSYLGIHKELQIKLAIETSLAAVVLNTSVSGYSHYKRGKIDFSIVKQFIIGIILGSIIGAIVTKIAPSDDLEIFFAIFECLIGLYFLFSPHIHESDSPIKFNILISNGLGIVVGVISVLLGIGGGFFMVPIFLFLRLSLRRAIGTSSILTCVVALLGSVILLFHSLGDVKEPYALGYLYFPAFIPLAIGAIAGAPFGAKLTHVLPTTLLKRGFGVLLVLLGLFIFWR